MGSSSETTRLKDRTEVIVRETQADGLHRSPRFSPTRPVDIRRPIPIRQTKNRPAMIRGIEGPGLEGAGGPRGFTVEAEGVDHDLIIPAPRA
jgi:hypothetical protein